MKNIAGFNFSNVKIFVLLSQKRDIFRFWSVGGTCKLWWPNSWDSGRMPVFLSLLFDD